MAGKQDDILDMANKNEKNPWEWSRKLMAAKNGGYAQWYPQVCLAYLYWCHFYGVHRHIRTHVHTHEHAGGWGADSTV